MYMYNATRRVNHNYKYDIIRPGVCDAEDLSGQSTNKCDRLGISPWEPGNGDSGGLVHRLPLVNLGVIDM